MADYQGNIDLNNRPIVKNEDGTYSTVKSASFNIDGKEVLLPTIGPNGERWTNDQAVQNYFKTGKNLGIFDNVESANKAAIEIHNQQAKIYDKKADYQDLLNSLPTESTELPKKAAEPAVVQLSKETPQNETDLLNSIPEETTPLGQAYQSIPEQDPDKTAKILQVSHETQQPEEFVQENLPQIEADAKKPTDDYWYDVHENSPATASWLMKDPKNLAITHDDVEPLRKNESIFDDAKSAIKLMLDPSEKINIASNLIKGQITPIKTGFTTGVLQVQQAQLGYKQMVESLVTGKHSGKYDQELYGIESKMADLSKDQPGFNPFYFAAQQVPNMLFMGLKSAERGVEGGLIFGLGAAAIGQVGPQALTPEEIVTVPAATATGMQVGGRLGALESVAILEAGSAYRQLINLKDKNGNGVDARKAAEVSLAVGLINSGLQYITLKALLRTIPGGDKVLNYFAKDSGIFKGVSPGEAAMNAAKNYLLSIGTATTTGVAQEAAREAAPEILKKISPNTDFEKPDLKSFLSNVSKIISPAMQASMLLGAPGTLGTIAMEINRIGKTDLNRQVYNHLGENADNSKLASRSKEAYADHVNDLAVENGRPDTIIPVEAFQKKSADLGFSPLQLAAELGIDQYYQEATKNDGGDMTIPTGTWLANTKALEKDIKQPIYSKFSEDIKYSHDDYTPREKQQLGEYYQNQIKKAADNAAQDKPEIQDARVKIQQKAFDELVAAGTKKDVAKAQSELYADMVATTAGRVKDATPDEVAQGMVRQIIGQDEIIKPADSMAQFAGLKSMTADNLKLDETKTRLNAGENADTIRKETGWFKGPDDKFRYEISDDKAAFTFDPKGELPRDIIYKSSNGNLKLGDILDHPELYRAYPWLQDAQVNYDPNLKNFEGLTAYFHPGSKSFNLSPDAIKNKPAIMHEVQHAIQDYEGFDGADMISSLVKSKEDIEQLEQNVSEMEDAFFNLKNYHDPNRNEDISIYKRMGFLNKLNRDRAILDQIKNPKPSGEPEAAATGARADLTLKERMDQAPAIMVVNGKEIPVKNQELYQEQKTNFQGGGNPLGAYNPLTKQITLAMESANPSTFLHEMGHAWVTFTSDMAKAGRLSEDYQKDWNTLTDWLEYKPDQTELTTAQQEKFARAFEAYLQEGKAPKIELASVFAKFKRWLMRVYESVTHPSLGLINKSKVGDEVKNVMDRMFASEEEIKASEYFMNYNKELELSGVDPKVQAKLSEYRQRAHDRATAKLMAEQMKELTAERKQEIEDYRKKVKDTAENNIRGSNLYRAIELLNSWKKPEEESVQAQAGQKYRERTSVKTMAQKYIDGSLTDAQKQKFDLVADSLDFYSGEDLANKIIDKKVFKKEIDAIVESEVTQKYPDLKNTDAIREKAIEALHGDRQLEVMATEREIYRSMLENADARAKAQRYGQTKAWLEADIAKQKAEDYLNSIPVGKLSGISKYITAERMNAIKSLKALQRNDYQEAAGYKQQQMISHSLALGVIKLQKTKDFIDRQFRNILKKKMLSYANQDAFEQSREIMRRFGLIETQERPAVPLEDYLRTLKNAFLSDDDDGSPVDVADFVTNESFEKPLNDLTMEQYRQLLNSVKNVIHVSASLKKFFRLQKQQDIDETINNLADVAKKNLKPRKRPRAVQRRFDNFKNNVSDYLFSLEQIDTVLGRLDGWEDFGPWHDTISSPVREAANNESNLRLDVMGKLRDVWGKYTNKEIKDLFHKKIQVPQFGIDTENPITKQELMAIALNMGNETNRDRIFDTTPVGFYPQFNWSQDGRPEADAAIQSVLEEHLNARDWDTVQNLWDVIDSYWPQIKDVHKEVTGFEPEKVDAVPFEVTLHDGSKKSMRGGYYPLVGDPRYSEKIAVRELTGQPLYEENNPAFKAMTKTSHTKNRVNAKYAVTLNLDIINRHLNDVIHDIAFRPLIYDLRRLISNNNFSDTVKNYTGEPGYRYIKQWVSSVASGGNTEKFATDQLSRFIRWANNRVTRTIILGRLSILAQNFSNVFMAPNRVKGFGFNDTLNGFLGRGLLNYWPKTVLNWKAAAEMRNFVFDRSPFMRDRAENPEYTLRDFKGVNVTSKKGISDFLLGLIGASDDMTNIPLWHEAYNKKLNETNDTAEAVKYADLLVYRIVGSGRKYDMAKILRGTDIEKLFAKFYSFWNVEYNNWVRELGQQGKEPIANAPKFMGFVASRLMFVYMGSLLANQLPDPNDTDKRKLGQWVHLFATYPLSFYPFAREIGTMMIDSAMGNYASGYRPAPAASLATDFSRAAGNFSKWAKGDGQTQDLLESVSKIVDFGVGIPYQFDNWFWNAYDYVVNGMAPEFKDFYRRRPHSER